MRSLAITLRRADRRGREGNSPEWNIRVSRLVGRGVKGLGSVLQHYGVIAVIVPTEVSLQTET